jgi:putative transposase
MIDHHHALPIKRQAELVGISRGTVYYLAAPADAAELALMRRMDWLHLEHPFMGARMLRDMLNRKRDAQGAPYPQVGRKYVTTLMRRMGINALHQKPGTSSKHPGHTIYPYLLRGVKIARSNQAWALDTTYSTPSQRGPPGRGRSCLSMSGMHCSMELMLQ